MTQSKETLESKLADVESENTSLKEKLDKTVEDEKAASEKAMSEKSSEITKLTEELTSLKTQFENISNEKSEEVKEKEKLLKQLQEEKREREILSESLKKQAEGNLQRKINELAEEKDTMKKNLESIIEELSHN